MTIYFQKLNKEYGCFSNFYPSPIEIDGINYATAEHYYQAMKAKNIEDHDYVNAATSPAEAKRRGKSIALRDNWENIKNGIMEIAIATKFSQHDNLAEILLSTGDNELVELANYDLYWGQNDEGKGKNMLGKMLMKLRNKIGQNE